MDSDTSYQSKDTDAHMIPLDVIRSGESLGEAFRARVRALHSTANKQVSQQRRSPSPPSPFVPVKRSLEWKELPSKTPKLMGMSTPGPHQGSRSISSAKFPRLNPAAANIATAYASDPALDFALQDFSPTLQVPIKDPHSDALSQELPHRNFHSSVAPEETLRTTSGNVMNRPSTSNTIQTASSAGSSEHVEQPACMNDLAKVAPAVLDILELDNYGGFQHLSWEQKYQLVTTTRKASSKSEQPVARSFSHGSDIVLSQDNEEESAPRQSDASLSSGLPAHPVTIQRFSSNAEESARRQSDASFSSGVPIQSVTIQRSESAPRQSDASGVPIQSVTIQRSEGSALRQSDTSLSSGVPIYPVTIQRSSSNAEASQATSNTMWIPQLVTGGVDLSECLQPLDRFETSFAGATPHTKFGFSYFSTDAPPKNWLKYGQLSTANVSEQVAGQHTVIASAQRQLGLQSSEMIVDSDSSMNLAAGGSQYQSLHFSQSKPPSEITAASSQESPTAVKRHQRQLGLQSSNTIVDSDSSITAATGGSPFRSPNFPQSKPPSEITVAPASSQETPTTAVEWRQHQLGLQSSNMIVNSDSSINPAAGGSQFQSPHFPQSKLLSEIAAAPTSSQETPTTTVKWCPSQGGFLPTPLPTQMTYRRWEKSRCIQDTSSTEPVAPSTSPVPERERSTSSAVSELQLRTVDDEQLAITAHSEAAYTFADRETDHEGRSSDETTPNLPSRSEPRLVASYRDTPTLERGGEARYSQRRSNFTPASTRDHTVMPASKEDIVDLSQKLSQLTDNIGHLVEFCKSNLPTSRRQRTSSSQNNNAISDSDEDQSGRLPCVQSRRRRRTLPPKRRSPAKITLENNIRYWARKLMYPDTFMQKPLPPFTNVPSTREVENYDPSQDGEACTETNFRPDLNAPPGTPWNQSVTSVFVQSFVSADRFECEDEELIRAGFSVHLKSLRNSYKNVQRSEDANIERQKQSNRAERKRNLFHRRLDVARTDPQLRHHALMLTYLGVDGMSSDESDHDSGLPQYRILVKPWRNPVLAPWLRVFDALHRRSRFRPVDRATRGAQPHLRIVSSKQDGSRAAVTHLPKNAYNSIWLSNLPDYDLRRLHPQDETYSFSHSPGILAEAQDNSGKPSTSRIYV